MPIDLDAYALTDTAEGTILTSALERIKALNLSQINEENQVIRKAPWITSGLQFPCTIVSPAPEQTPWDAATNEMDRTIFAFFVSLAIANERDITTTGMGLHLKWREQIRRSFQNATNRTWDLRSLTGAIFEKSSVESGDKFIPDAIRMQLDASYYLVRMQTKETRG